MRRSRYLMLGIILFTTSGLMAQDSTFFSNQFSSGIALLRKAQSFNDAGMEKIALFGLLTLNENDTTALRGIANAYYNEENYTSSILVGLDYLKRYPGDVFALEICALSFEKLRIYDKAVQYYQDFYLRNENDYILYKIAYLQYAIKRNDESISNIDLLLNRVDPAETLQLNASNNQLQEVLFKAALYNLKGLVTLDLGNKAAAKRFFEEALKLSPDFDAAKFSLDDLNKE